MTSEVELVFVMSIPFGRQVGDRADVLDGGQNFDVLCSPVA